MKIFASSKCTMALPTTRDIEMPVGGSQRPFFVTALLFGLTMLIVYLLVLVPQIILLQREEVLEKVEPRHDNLQKRTEPINDYKFLNDTNCRLQIPLFNLPYLYKVRFKIFMPWKEDVDFGSDNWTSRGYVIMYFIVRRTNSRLQMHVLNLDIGEVYIQDDMNRNITITQVSRIYPQVIDIHTAAELIENMNYSAHIHFTGKIGHGRNAAGFQAAPYRMESGEIRYTVVTHAQTQDTRAIMPCIDVPEAKAKFLVSITHPREITALANGAEISREYEGDWTTTKFDESPHMSTYLFAVALSEYPYIETKYGDMKVRIYGEQIRIDDAFLALNTAPKVLKKLEDYFMTPAPLKKLDFFESTQLKVFAMENWGLITSQPDGLFYNKNYSDLGERYYVLATVAHEIAHQWFGNLVTMKWWNNLWLNEGFATLIQIKVLEQLGEYQVGEKMLQKAQLMRSEMISPKISSRPEFPTFTPELMFETAYTKPALMLKMVEQIVGEEVFREGIIRFLKNFSYRNADHNDLMEALTYAYDSTSGTRFDGQNFTLTELIESWIYQAGYPAVLLKSRDDGKIEATQEAAYFGNVARVYYQKWIIPIFIRETKHYREREIVWLKGNSTAVFDMGKDVVIDREAQVLMRVLYDDILYSRIIKTLTFEHVLLPVNARGRLIDDAFTWAEYEVTSYGIPLRICTYLVNETMYVPFGMLSAHLDMFFSRMNVMPEYKILKKYIAAVMSPAFFRIQTIETHLRTTNEQHVYEVTCKRLCWAGFIPCVEEARKTVEYAKKACGSDLRFSSTCNTIPKSLRKCYYGTVVMYGQQEDFDYLYEKYLKEKSISERIKLWTGLVASQRYEDIKKAWDDFLFVQLPWYTSKQAQELCADYSKYYHPNSNFLDYSMATQDKIIKSLNQPDLEIYIYLFARTLTQLEQRPKFNAFIDEALKRFPKLRNRHNQFGRVEIAVNFRKGLAIQIIQNLTEILETLEDLPLIQV